jgi:hypothetical protein
LRDRKEARWDELITRTEEEEEGELIAFMFFRFFWFGGLGLGEFFAGLLLAVVDGSRQSQLAEKKGNKLRRRRFCT